MVSRDTPPSYRSGTFPDPALEQAFWGAMWTEARMRALIGIVATTVACLIFVPGDLMTLHGGQLVRFLAIRGVIALLAVAAVLLVRRAATFRQGSTIALVQQYVFFTLNALVFNHPLLARNGAIFMPIVALLPWLWIPGRGWQIGLISAYSTLISLVFWGLGDQADVGMADLRLILLLSMIASLFGFAIRSYYIRMRRQDFMSIENERRAKDALTEAKRAAEAGLKAKSDFLAMMSHEIRTPMNGILGMVRLILARPLDAQTHDQLLTVRDSAEALLTVLNDILDFSKLEASRLDIECIAFDPRRLLDDIGRLMGERAADKGLSFTIAIDAAVPPALTGDPSRLRQILINLIGNAIKFTPAGQVDVRLERRPENSGADTVPLPFAVADAVPLRFSVADTGIGISERDRARLFQEFVQIDSSIARRFGGTSLGLAICRRLVILMGGRIDVASTPGQGSRFWFDIALPAATALSDPSHGQEDALPPAPVRPLRILLAEDNRINQRVAVGLLEGMGHHVAVAENGIEALERLAQGGFDLILMDMQMPDMDGLEATARIRALPDPALAGLPIIALTANALQGDAERCLDAGMNDYVTKPIGLGALAAALARNTSPLPTDADPADTDPADTARLDELREILGPDGFADLVATFERQADASRALLARADADANARGLAAHDLKSAAGALGLTALCRLADRIEDRCRTGDGDPAPTAALTEEIDRALIHLRAALSATAP